MGKFNVVSCPSPDLALANCVFANPRDGFDHGQHVFVRRKFPCTIRCVSAPHCVPVFSSKVCNIFRHDPTRTVSPGFLGFTAFQRQWIGLSASGDSVDVEPIDWSQMGNDVYLESIDIEVRGWVLFTVSGLPHLVG